ncbi:MAG TPA: thioredoxin domain-containing protein [Candidatus Brocadiia bacterium]|nr:thioredoxin domain-containing protein [Candidatus Brocadiia bacterium]
MFNSIMSSATGLNTLSMAMLEENGKRKANRLAVENSPYLLQHAYNPVDWHPWGEEAFRLAAAQDKPIFLSIGYSTCHWCHVMERESFEDKDVARLMNESFICVKVDREERPDLDGYFMSLCQMMTGEGGWPLTIIMTPGKVPIFAGTYIPKENRYGRMGMMSLIPKVSGIWRNNRSLATMVAEKVAAIANRIDSSEGEEPGEGALHAGYAQLYGKYDRIHGGFGDSPKFPTTHNLTFLLRYWKRTGNPNALAMVENTILKIRMGGIYDHIGLGAHRYSTDREWLVPHFEKMLYDQALLLMACAETFHATRNAEYRQIAQEIISYVRRDMTSPDGAFYSAEDADSEGSEGEFYMWTREEVQEALNDSDAKLFLEIFGIKENGNLRGEISTDGIARAIPHLRIPLDETASQMGLAHENLRERLESIRLKLFAQREKRIHPFKDDKILADWNGLMIAAMAKAAWVFDDKSYSDAAIRCCGFIMEKMMSRDGSLFHRFRDDQVAVKGFLDDYVFLAWGHLELYEATFETEHLQSALRLMQYVNDHFRDAREGGYHFTSDVGERLPIRRKESGDGAIPSGNAVAMLNLLKLSRMTGLTELESLARQTAKAFADRISRFPIAHTQFLQAVDFAIGPSVEVVIVRGDGGADAKDFINALRDSYIPEMSVLVKSSAGGGELAAISPFTSAMKSIGGKTTAHVCRGFVCAQPVTDPAAMIRIIVGR